MRKFSLLIAATAAIAGCTQAPPRHQTMEADARLQRMLAGKVAGSPIGCIPHQQSGKPSLVTPGAIAFQVNPGLVYVSNVEGSGCEGADDPMLTLVSKSSGPGLCSGDTIEIHDPRTRILVGACTLGPITAYSRP